LESLTGWNLFEIPVSNHLANKITVSVLSCWLKQPKHYGDTMNKQEIEQAREDYKKIWQDMTLDYDSAGMPTVKVSYAAVLTRPLFYPVNKFAYGLAILMRRKTFTKIEIDHMRAMGFVVEVEVKKVELPEACR
jgi:hypothetical protein